jgi:chemotaxis protein MotB
LLDSGLEEGKIARVVGLADSVPFDKANPSDPINRRISIIMMTKQAQDAALSQEQAEAVPPATLPAPVSIKPLASGAP